MRYLLLALCLTLASTFAAPAAAQEGDIVIVIAQPPSGSAALLQSPSAQDESPLSVVDAQERTRPRIGLAVAGAAVFVASYGLNLGGSLLYATFPGMWGRSGSFAEYSLIPLAGPWLQMSVLRQGEEALGVVLGAAGVAQAIGAIVLIAGITSTETVRSSEPTYAVLPYANAQGGGLSVVGSF